MIELKMFWRSRHVRDLFFAYTFATPSPPAPLPGKFGKAFLRTEGRGSSEFCCMFPQPLKGRTEGVLSLHTFLMQTFLSQRKMHHPLLGLGGVASSIRQTLRTFTLTPSPSPRRERGARNQYASSLYLEKTFCVSLNNLLPFRGWGLNVGNSRRYEFKKYGFFIQGIINLLYSNRAPDLVE